MRDVDDEAAGQRDLGREPGALRLHRVLDRLDEDRLAALDQVLDLAGAAAALELGADDLVDVEEAVLLEADLDERGLHPGQHVVDRARGRCCRRSSAARAARGRPRRRRRPRARRRASRPGRPRRAARAWPSGSGARRGAVRRGGRGCARGPCARPPSLARPAAAGSARGSPAAARAGRRRRRSRRRLRRARARRGFRGGASWLALACSSGRRRGSSGASGAVSGSGSTVGTAAAGGACSVALRRRNQGSGKEDLLHGTRSLASGGRASRVDGENRGIALPEG